MGILVGSVDHQQEIDSVVRKARVVISAAGPFSLHGTPVVDACVRLGVHYCDITGEVPWVKTLVSKYHDQAVASKTFIVPCCGFDSIPSGMLPFPFVNKELEAGREESGDIGLTFVVLFVHRHWNLHDGGLHPQEPRRKRAS